MPRVPPVTKATRPCKRGRLTVDSVRLLMTDMSSLLTSVARAPAQPVGELGPDLMLGLRARHEPDVAALAVEIRDVLARDQVEQRDRAVRWGDVIGSRGHHEQVLFDPRQVDAFP